MRTRIVLLIAFSLAVVVAFAGTGAAQSEDPNPEAPQWLEARYDVALDEGMQALTLEGDVDLREAEATSPSLEFACGGSSCSADDLREAYQQADESSKQQLVDGIEAAVEDRIEASLAGMATGDTQPTSQATVDEAALAEEPTGDPYHPAIPIEANGSVELGLVDETGITAEQGQALFAMGAQVEQAIEQEVEPGTNLTLTLAVSSPVHVLEAEQGTPSEDGTEITWREANWDGGQTARIEDQVTLGDPDVEVPERSDAELDVTLDISNVNVAYGAMFSDQAPAEADVAIEVDGRFASIENPREIDRIQLDYLSADALRIALEHDLLDTSQLLAVEDQARQQIKQTFEGMTGEPVDVGGPGFPAGDLSTEALGTPTGTGEAIEMRLNASQTIPFPPEQPSQPAEEEQGPSTAVQGFTVTTLSMGTLDLPRLDTQYDVEPTITLVLPEGLELDFEAPPGYTVEQETRDGRQAYAFTSNGDAGGGEGASIQNADIVVNHPFVWNVFWPLLVALGLLLVVLPAVVIGLTIRRRRNRGPPTAGESAQPVSGSQASQREEPSEDA